MWQPVFASHDAHDVTVGAVRLLDVRSPVAAAVRLAESDEPLVLVGHRNDSTRIRVVAAYVSANQPDRLVARASTDHAPLAGVAALDQAATLAKDAGHALSIWRDLLDRTWSAAVLSSVTKLGRPNPTMLQHLRSWLPRSRFVVQQGDSPRSVSSPDVDQLLVDLSRRSHDMFVTAGTDDEVVQRVVSQLSPTQLRTVDDMAGWPQVYGITEQLQMALLPTDAARVVRAPGPVCDGCGTHAADAVCPFCRTRTSSRPQLVGEGS